MIKKQPPFSLSYTSSYFPFPRGIGSHRLGKEISILVYHPLVHISDIERLAPFPVASPTPISPRGVVIWRILLMSPVFFLIDVYPRSVRPCPSSSIFRELDGLISPFFDDDAFFSPTPSRFLSPYSLSGMESHPMPLPHGHLRIVFPASSICRLNSLHRDALPAGVLFPFASNQLPPEFFDEIFFSPSANPLRALVLCEPL